MQRILVVQQEGSGDAKVEALRRRARDIEITDIFDIPGSLPAIIDESAGLLPSKLDADLVLSFVKHPDLAHDLAAACRDAGIPLIASGQKLDVEGAHTPPT